MRQLPLPQQTPRACIFNPPGWVLVGAVYGLLLDSVLALVGLVPRSLPPTLAAVTLTVALLLAAAVLTAHVVCMLTPNVPPSNVHACVQCDGATAPHVRHCSICKRCTVLQEHHCFFVNNCVGANNYRAHLLLLVYSFAFCLITFWLLSTTAVHCGFIGHWQPLPPRFENVLGRLDPSRLNILAYCGVGPPIAGATLIALVAAPLMLPFISSVLMGVVSRAGGVDYFKTTPGNAKLPDGRSVAVHLWRANFRGPLGCSWFLPLPAREVILDDGLPAYLRREAEVRPARRSGYNRVWTPTDGSDPSVTSAASSCAGWCGAPRGALD